MSRCLVKIFSYTYPFHFRELRYAAYRQFTWWLYGKLGRSHRRIIPACVVHHIRTRFPNDITPMMMIQQYRLLGKTVVVWINKLYFLLCKPCLVFSEQLIN